MSTPAEPPKQPRRLLGKFALGMAAGLGLSVVFVGALAVSLVAHLNAPSARRAIASMVSDVASKPFLGRIEIHDIERIALRQGEIDVGEVTIRDPRGRPVITGHGAHVAFHPMELARAFLAKAGATPTIDRVVVDRVNVVLDASQAEPTPPIAEAFAPKEAGPPGPPKSANTFRLSIAEISAREVGVSGALFEVPFQGHGQVQHGSLAVMPEGVWVNVEGASLALSPMAGVSNAPIHVDVDGELRVPFVTEPRAFIPTELRNVRAVLASGGVNAFVSGQLLQTAVEVHVSVPQTSPTSIEAVLGVASPIPVPASIEVDAEGTLDRAEVVARASLGGGTVTTIGWLDIAAMAQKPGPEQPRIGIAEARVLVAGIAPRIFAKDAPAVTVGTDSIVEVTATTAGTEILVKGTSTGAPEKAPGSTATIALDLRALVGKGSTSGSGNLVASAYGARSEVRFDFEQHPGGGHANAAITANVPRMEDLGHFVPGLPLRGGVDVVANLAVDFDKKTFGGSATVHGRSIAHPSATIPEIAIVAHAGGTFSEPTFGGVVDAGQIVLSPKSPHPTVLHDVNAKIAGTPTLVGVGGHVRTDLGQDIEIATHLSPRFPSGATGLRIAGTHVLLKRGDFVGDLAIKELSVQKSTITVTGLRLSSTAGGLRLDGTFDPKKHTMDIDVASTELDVDAIVRALGVEDGSVRGKLRLDVKLASLPAAQRKWITENTATESSLLHLEQPAPPKIDSAGAPYLSGRVHIDLHDGHLADIVDLGGHVDLDIEDRLVEGTVDVAVKDLARVMLRGAAMVPGRLDDMKSWEDAIGRVDLHLPTVDFTKVEAFLAKRSKTAPPQLAGTFSLHGHLERARKNGAPIGWINGWTRDFAYAKGTTAIKGIDLRLRASLDSTSDAQGENGTPDPKAPLQLDLTADVHDKKGALAIFHVGTEGTWTQLSKVGTSLSDMPVVADLVVPARALHDLPPSITKKLPLDGNLGLSATLRGTLAEPKLELRATLDDVIGEGGSPHVAYLSTTYDGEKAKVHLDFAPKRSPDKTQVLLDSEIAFSAKDALEGKLAWSAKGDLELRKFPIGIVGGALGLRGQANGKIHLDRVNDPKAPSPTVDGRIDFAKLKIGDTAFDDAFLVVKVDEHAASGQLAVHGGKSGTIDAKGRVPLVWKNNGSVAIATDAPIEGNVDVKGLRLAILKPFVEELDEVDGRLDAHLVTNVRKNEKGQWIGAPEGTITVRDGIVVADAIGSRWSNVLADIEVKNGKMTIKQIDMKSVGRGRAKIVGEATFAGFSPQTFHVQLDSKRFGVAASGARVGELSGKVTADGKMVPNGDGRERMDIVVKLDDVVMDLASEAGKKVQSLEQDPSIAIAQPIGKPVETAKSGSASVPIRVSVKIPHPVTVRRDDLRVAVEGNPSVVFDGVPKVSGEVVIKANEASPWQQPSWLDVAGKRFYVHESHVKFAGTEELDPLLDVHVRWKAPDSTLVEVSVTGHVSAPKLDFKALDSNGGVSQMSRSEIMSLLVLGRRDAGSSQQQQQAEQGATSQAAALVEGMTGAIFGRQLQKLLPPSVSLTVGAGHYAGGYQHENLYFEVAFNAGGSQMGPTSIGQTQPKTTFSVDWRFARMWSLMTTVGDTGATLVDLIWSYRY
ncbi:MAG: translocation/assembly module TamB domain-containing protein [Polyangiales bacterium]